jgi:hypothetical protein
MRSNPPDPVRRRTSIAATSLLCALVYASPARAQSAEAEALFDAGDKLMSEGKVPEACESFEASNKIEPRAGTLIRLGECREQNHQLAAAWSAYKDALTRVKDPNKREIAASKAAELEPKLSHLTVTVPDDHRAEGLAVTRNGKPVDPMVWNRPLPVDGGDYVIVASAPGYREWTTTITVPPERGESTAQVPVLEALPKPPVAIKPPEVPEPEPAPLFTPKRKIAVGLAGASVVTLIVGSVLGVSAKGKQTDAHTLCPDPSTPCAGADLANQLESSGHTRAIIANVMFGTAAVAAIGAGVLWALGRPETSTKISVVPSVTPNGTAVMVMGRF